MNSGGPYAILRIKKLTSMGDIDAVAQHLERECEMSNADHL